jgi:predicted small lipoprotein YifL
MRLHCWYLITALPLLAACGQKGALYLPGPTRTEVPATPSTDASATADAKVEDKEDAAKAGANSN